MEVYNSKGYKVGEMGEDEATELMFSIYSYAVTSKSFTKEQKGRLCTLQLLLRTLIREAM